MGNKKRLDLIDRRALLAELDKFINPMLDANGLHFLSGLSTAIAEIEEAPTVDAVEVVHGEWAHLGGDEWCCTSCGEVITTEGSWENPTKKYCPNCGAMMDGEI